jgi:hypothetical protein
MFAVFIEFGALVFHTYALIRHLCRGWGPEFVHLRYKLNESMNKLFHTFLDVVTDSTSDWSLNFELLFIILYWVDVHILEVVL